MCTIIGRCHLLLIKGAVSEIQRAHSYLLQEIEEVGQAPQRHAKVGVPVQMATNAY